MADVKPFTGIRYNRAKVPRLEQVTTPPYDVISDDQKRMYHERHPKNVIRLTLGESHPGDDDDTNWYTRAAAYLNQWIEEGTLIQDEKPTLYLVRRDYVDKWGRQRIRHGFTALVRVEDPDRRIILGHELTFDDVIQDRLQLIRATQSNPCPIFALYTDPRHEVIQTLRSSVREPEVTVVADDGSKETLWLADDPEMCTFVRRTMLDKVIFIADGHHRYATAQLYRDEMRRATGTTTGSEPYDYAMMTLVALEDEGLAIYPPHRLVRGLRNFDRAGFLGELEQYFEVVPVVEPATLRDRVSTLVRLMANGNGTERRFGVVLKGTEPRLLTLKHETNAHPWLSAIQESVWSDLDVPILHRLVIEGMLGITASSGAHVQYTPDEFEAAQLVESENVQMALLLNPPTPADVKKVSLAGALMPHKSTYFYPKLLSGLVINKLY